MIHKSYLIHKSKPCGEVTISGSKSYANRAILISAIAKDNSELYNLPNCDDVNLMIKCIESLGVKIEKFDKFIKIYGNNGIFNNIAKSTEVNCGIAGTTSRFITALAYLANAQILINGTGKLLERPIQNLVDVLSNLGAKIKYLGLYGSIPILIDSRNLTYNNESVTIDGSISSQFISALLMISPKIQNLSTIFVSNDSISQPYIDITLDIMNKFGVNIKNKEYNQYIIDHNSYKGEKYIIEGDWSSASYFFALAIITNSSIEVHGLNASSIQGDSKIISIIKDIGGEVAYYKNAIKVCGTGKINPININMEKMPDISMTIACICAFANGVSKITGLGTLKNKETDRLVAMHNELAKLGIKTYYDNNSITIHGRPNTTSNQLVEIETYHDHRIAMCFAIIGAKLGNIIIKNPNVVSKSMPEFWHLVEKIGVKIDNS